MGYDLDDIRVENFIAGPEDSWAAKVFIDSEKGIADYKKGIFIALPVLRNEKPAVFNINCDLKEREKAVDLLDAALFDETYKKKIDELENENRLLRNRLEGIEQENGFYRRWRAV
ncbi:hypothetical protein [Petroclostridium sp. X23]|uniref:hypothetical protein n=1 Tax=Petroclostridium sp. X23 TaxID=3045146 RepID=UPI0024ACD5B8|nr:hypothetical protein [Petroclostridium sp. X23]WHH59124.1 hypothetical protein QKW49_25620 [Petroclostridium sp. X23]